MSERHSYPVYYEAPGVFVEADTGARVNVSRRPWPVDPREHVLNPRKLGPAYIPEWDELGRALAAALAASERAMKDNIAHTLYADTHRKCWRSRWFGSRLFKYRPGWLICGHCGKLQRTAWPL